MKKHLIVSIALCLATNMAIAAKPEWADDGKPSDEQKAIHKSAMNTKKEAEERSDDVEEKIEKAKKEKDKAAKKEEDENIVKGLEKQKEKKATQEQKELSKASEQGREASSNRKKWWKFWE